jgi:hypothetical protein
MKNTIRVCLLAVMILIAPAVLASDTDELTAMLHDFLANAGKADAHERFWADDLVYSSSAGLRFGKAEITAGFADPDAASDEPPADGSEVLSYFKTGMFLKRGGEWKAVAWQATEIPPAAD